MTNRSAREDLDSSAMFAQRRVSHLNARETRKRDKRGKETSEAMRRPVSFEFQVLPSHSVILRAPFNRETRSVGDRSISGLKSAWFAAGGEEKRSHYVRRRVLRQSVLCHSFHNQFQLIPVTLVANFATSSLRSLCDYFPSTTLNAGNLSVTVPW